MFKKLLSCLFLLYSYSISFGQTFGDFSFANLPQNYQLYPRNVSNAADISIRAKTESNTTLGLFIYRNQQIKQVIKPTAVSNGLYTFNFSIAAELANYDLAFYAFNGKDSTLIVKRSNIVSGDVILVSGQSNAKLGPMDKNVYQGEWLRTYGKNKLILDLNSAYNKSDTLWNTQKLNLNLDPIASDYLQLGLGPFASELARLIIESEKIPIAVISNAQPTTTIDFHLNFTGNMDDPRGGDILYYKVKKANLQNDIKVFVFVQGEAEILDDVAQTWPSKFIQLKDKCKKFFPNLQKIAFPQLNIYEFKAKNSAWLRNEQRKLSFEKDYISWASVGNQGFDGLHYYGNKYLKEPNNIYLFENIGYFQMANEVGRLILKDLYKRDFSVQIQSPNLVKAYFPSAETRSKVILEFQEGQVLKIVKDTLVQDLEGKTFKHELKNNFFYDKFNQSPMGPYITNITTDGKNKLTIEFNVEYDGNTISYLPEYHLDSQKNKLKYPFPGPFIKNEFGMRAFAFSDITIEEKTVYSSEFKLYPNPGFDWIELRWPSVVNGELYVFDLMGRLLFTRSISNSRIININLFDIGLKSGKYYVQFVDDRGGSSGKSLIKL